jgi:hypothetical protein
VKRKQKTSWRGIDEAANGGEIAIIGYLAVDVVGANGANDFAPLEPNANVSATVVRPLEGNVCVLELENIRRSSSGIPTKQ